MANEPIISPDDVARWLGPDGAARAVAALLPDNEDGHQARHYADLLAIHAAQALDAEA